MVIAGEDDGVEVLSLVALGSLADCGCFESFSTSVAEACVAAVGVTLLLEGSMARGLPTEGDVVFEFRFEVAKEVVAGVVVVFEGLAA